MLDDAIVERHIDDDAYPRTYKLAPQWVLRLWVRAVFWSVCGAVGFMVLPHVSHLAFWEVWLLETLCFSLVCVGIYTLCGSLRYKVVLSADSIDVSGGVPARSMRREEIRGRRLFRGPGFSTIELAPKDEAAKSLRVCLRLGADPAFDHWFSALPDLDAQDLADSQQQLLHARHLSPATDEGTRSIKRLRQFAVAINLVSLGLLFEGYMLSVPPPSLVIALVVLPWIVIWIVARYQPLYRFSTNRGDRHLSLALPLIGPGAVLTYGTFSSIHTLDWSAAFTVTCVAAVLLTAAAAAADPWLRKRGKDVLGLLVFAALYGYGAGLQINALADSTNPQVYPATVLSKTVFHGHRGSTWSLSVGAWGPVSRASKVQVSQFQYRSSRRGDTVCVYLYPGAFGIRWYQVGHCEQGQARVAISPVPSVLPRVVDPLAGVYHCRMVAPTERFADFRQTVIG